MKTKYILHGGFKKGNEKEDNLAFYAEILKTAPKNPKILLVCFAKDDDRIPHAITNAIREFNHAKWQENLSYEIAEQNKFMDQVKLSDIIYFHGGATQRLLFALKDFPKLKAALGGKIIAGESAGANVIATYCYSPSAQEVIRCLGLLPIKIIPHYTKELEGKLNDVGPRFELVLLPEYEFKVIEED